jgi:hypothetical protein
MQCRAETVCKLVRDEQQMPSPGPGPAPGPNPLLGCTCALCSSHVSDRIRELQLSLQNDPTPFSPRPKLKSLQKPQPLFIPGPL